MHGSFDRRGESGNRMQRSWSIGFFAFPILLVIALIGLVIAQPAASRWISEAVQAEFGEGRADDAAHGSGGQPAAVIGRADPVAQAAGLQRAAHDLVEGDPPDDLAAAVEDHVRKD